MNDLAHKPSARYVVVKDMSGKGNGKMVGYAKWNVPIGDERLDVDNRYPAWVEDGDKDLLDTFFGALARERKKYMGDREYYCKLLTSSFWGHWPIERI